MKARYKETGEIVDVYCETEAIWVESDKFGPDKREWEESELEFINGMCLDDVQAQIDDYFENTSDEEISRIFTDADSENESVTMDGCVVRNAMNGLDFYINGNMESNPVVLPGDIYPDIKPENSPRRCRIEITLL